MDGTVVVDKKQHCKRFPLTLLGTTPKEMWQPQCAANAPKEKGGQCASASLNFQGEDCWLLESFK